MNLLEKIRIEALEGKPCSISDAIEISKSFDINDICDIADEIRKKWNGDSMDTCSIVNARSGRCSEDCKWCAQSRFHNTGCNEYDIIPHDEVMRAVELNTNKGVHRFSLVTSGRKVAPADIKRFCDIFRDAAKISQISLCASMGLLTKDELQQLKDAGVNRYHCNLETSASFFPHLCTTHSHEDKLRTIRAAREIGMEVCCGGIIGMGETLEQRLQLAEEAREAGACSIPINILNPVKGTALENQPLISEEDIIMTVALFKLIAPKCTLRFAGGRLRLSDKATRRILHGGMSGALVGDMLTTVGNNIDQDRDLFTELGFKW
ncbi:MAG: biotin synthase BioB [Muribaculaceae bacterium]